MEQKENEEETKTIKKNKCFKLQSLHWVLESVVSNASYTMYNRDFKIYMQPGVQIRKKKSSE